MLRGLAPGGHVILCRPDRWVPARTVTGMSDAVDNRLAAGDGPAPDDGERPDGYFFIDRASVDPAALAASFRDPAAPPRGPSFVEWFVAQHAGGRTRVVDEHRFVGKPGPPLDATFRLQLFTAPGLRPVAIATQTMREGMSLTNGAELFAAAVWRRYLPEDGEPPVWIQLCQLRSRGPASFRLVLLTVDGPHALRGARWLGISLAQVEQLLGGPVDTGRGCGFVPRPPDPEADESYFYRTVWVARLPRPHPFRQPGCMPVGTPLYRRVLRQLVPRRRPRGCCWYHGGDWHAVCRAAIRLVAQAQREHLSGDQLCIRVMHRAESEGMDRWALEALESLLEYGTWIDVNEQGYVNGQHRAQALLDAGVRRTVVVGWRDDALR